MSRNAEKLSQVLSQRLQQRLNLQNVVLGRVLEMTTPEFEDEIRRELDDNPALETIDESAPEALDSDENADEAYNADDYRAASGRASDPTSWAADEGESMYETLMNRLMAEHELNADDTKIAAYIIGNLDSNGYMTRSVDDICDDLAIAEGLDVDRREVREVLQLVRSLEPAGIAAVDLRDCLLLQLMRKEPSVEVLTAREIISNYFDLFSKMHYERLESALGISPEALRAALDVIKGLNPKPASGLEASRPADRARHVVPDFNLDVDEDSGQMSVSLAGDMPALSLEGSFAIDPKLDRASTREREALAFIKRKRDEALNFINIVELRNLTLLTIANAIVMRQRAFFASGDKSDIKPMILKDIGADTGFDLSIISRAAAGKYISTPHGIYPLKLFFNERPDTESDVSSHEILAALTEMIEKEDKSNPLSDRELTDGLAAKGYDIARRTVAKYRERLGLPVARLRKTY